MDGRTAAATLGVGPQATRDEIRQAFRALAKVLHPDAGPAGSMERFIAARQAADLLLRDAPTVAPAPAPASAPVPFPASALAPASAPASVAAQVSASAPGVARFGGPAGRTRGGAASVSTSASTGTPATAVDLTDTPRRSPRPSGPIAGPAAKRDAKGLSFADHLAAALARP